MSLTQPPQIIDQFKDELDRCKVTGSCRRTFIRVEKLKRWMTEPRVEALLDAVYSTWPEGPAGLPESAANICGDDTKSLLVFAILLDIGHGDLIDRFLRVEFYDSSLPINLFNLNDRLGLDVKDIATEFDNLQYSFCPVRFELGHEKSHHSKRILPICRKEEINQKGGTASIWQIEVLEEFIGPKLKRVVEKSYYNNPNDTLGDRYQFALKTFKAGNRHLCKNEIEAFRALKMNKGMIQYLGSFDHQEPGADSSTHNILLEFGQFDLEEYFHCHAPPSMPSEIFGFWKDLFEIASAVRDIHTFETKKGDIQHEYFGLHADIKPDNILQVQKRFKLADPGFARFVKGQRNQHGQSDWKTKIQGGTATFGPPECHPAKRGRGEVHFPRAIDMWSLGCVFSIAATWVILGAQGIKLFTFVREKAVENKSKDPNSPLAVGGDFFHDGADVLEDVTNWHDHLRHVLRQSDTLTSQILDLIDKDMLRGDPAQRIDAKSLCNKLHGILQNSEPTQSHQLAGSLREAFIAYEENAFTETSPSEILEYKYTAINGPGPVPTGSQTRKSIKSHILNLPALRTTHRSEALEPPESPEHDIPRGSRNSLVRNGSNMAPIPLEVADRSPENHQPVTPQRPSNRQSQHKLPSITIPAQPQPEPKFIKQDVFQARAEIERLSKGLLRRRPKDALLSQHFGDRDIKFLVDNASTMAEYWDQATFLLETLVMKAKGQDENGMDLFFFNGPVKLNNSQDPAKFKEKMEQARPKTYNKSDIRNTLGAILFEYLNIVMARNRYGTLKPVRKLTIIILTDGKWEGMDNKERLILEKIIDFQTQLLAEYRSNGLVHRQVTFEFIQFGNDINAKYLLRKLDDELPSYGIDDIVDTEDARGDVNKMLLGSFVEEYDKRNDENLEIFFFPDQVQQLSPPQMDQEHGELRQHSRHPSGQMTYPPSPSPRHSYRGSVDNVTVPRLSSNSQFMPFRPRQPRDDDDLYDDEASSLTNRQLNGPSETLIRAQYGPHHGGHG